MKKINVGIIGRNFGYKVIYKAIKKIKGYKILGFAVKDRLSKNIISEDIKIYKNWRNLISDKKLNAVFISSPPNTHMKIIKYSIKKNKHIFCDKPVTTSLKDINYICNILKKKKLINCVNYEFKNIEAFQIFKKKYLTDLKINKVDIFWSIRVPSKGRTEWKNTHSKGGGNFFNYICHVLFYLEDFFGEIEVKKSKLENQKSYYKLKTNLFSRNKKININLNFKTIDKKSNSQSYHKITFYTDKDKFILFSKINNLYDQFYLLKNKRVIFKPKKIKFDFRLKPTLKNIISFKNSINKKTKTKPNFDNAKRIHSLINNIIQKNSEKQPNIAK